MNIRSIIAGVMFLPTTALAAISYSPAIITGVPALGGLSMLLLAIALAATAWRLSRNGGASRLIAVTALAIGALISTAGGVRLIEHAYAAATDFENPAGGSASIDCSLDQQHNNTSGTAIRIDAIDCTPSGGTLGTRQAGDPSPECNPSVVVANGTSCWTFTPACTGAGTAQGPINVGPGFNDGAGIFVPFPSADCWDTADDYLTASNLLIDINRSKVGGAGTDQIEYFWASSASDIAANSFVITNTSGNSINVPRNRVASEAPTGKIRGVFVRTTGAGTWTATLSNMRLVP
ncbi:MAG: midcut-by-XrtH protein [Zoogloeaceae bacterium]|nr:midcut-by-XrtH protein [Rhodocyclaceae bacterium]MCP5235320.1 midcut-by-XrtH protein [Zoogloeaceae bacterium]